ncbi:hypothetical protein [Aromatoleum aromaticum]|uniref:hypothetical protein n=1 Tax=Aromatoleum aromaticum TaxID=551760 RepID=UPI0002EDCF4A|nr:hypothetical protein [Aromatoleum aromaticum]
MIQAMGQQEAGEVALLMDNAYVDNATRELAQQQGFVPVVPPNPLNGLTAPRKSRPCPRRPDASYNCTPPPTRPVARFMRRGRARPMTNY